MLSTQLQTFAHSNGFTVKENLAFGVFEGFFVAISGKQSRKNAFISFYKEETDGEAFFNSELSQALNDFSEQYSILKYSLLDSGLSVETTADLLDFDELLNKLCTLLSEKGAKGAAFCSSCGKENCDENAVRKVISFNGEYYLVCGNCALEIFAMEQSMPSEDKFKKIAKHKNASTDTEDASSEPEVSVDELSAKEALGLLDDEESRTATEEEKEETAIKEESAVETSQDITEEEQIKPKKPRVKRGIAGAILGALMGLVLFVVAYIWLVPVVKSALTELFPGGNDYSFESEFISLAFSAVLSVLTYVFYSAFSGSKGLDRATTCIIISAVATIIAQYIGSVSIFVKESIVSFEHFTRSFKYFWHFPITDDIVRHNFVLLLMANLIVVIVVSFIFTVVSEGRVKRSAVEIYDF